VFYSIVDLCDDDDDDDDVAIDGLYLYIHLIHTTTFYPIG
jgi:hypothetical protein